MPVRPLVLGRARHWAKEVLLVEVVIGIDAHKRTHTAVVVDEVGRELDATTVTATSEDHVALCQWAVQWPQRRFAVEDCRHLTRRLESELLAAGEMLVRVPGHLMAGQLRGGRQRGKSDPIDALAVARAALQQPDLPTAELDGPARQLRLLVDYRETLVSQRTAACNTLRWYVHELAPELDSRPRGLRTRTGLDRLAAGLADFDGLVAELALDVIERCRQLNARITDLDRRIRQTVREVAPSLLAMPGCGPLSAAKLVGETGRASCFCSKAAYARFPGTAPVPVPSGNTARVRLSRGGNRQANTALPMIAVTHIDLHGPWRGRVEVELLTLKYIDWFNHRRVHGACGDVPPAEYEAIYYSANPPPAYADVTQ
jgi:transposase